MRHDSETLVARVFSRLWSVLRFKGAYSAASVWDLSGRLPVLAFTPEEWEAFTLGVKDGEFDLP